MPENRIKHNRRLHSNLCFADGGGKKEEKKKREEKAQTTLIIDFGGFWIVRAIF